MGVDVQITVGASEPTPERQPFDVHCKNCGHEWVPFYLPLTMDKRGQALMRNAGKACPMCVSDKVFVGKRPEKPSKEGEAHLAITGEKP